MDAVLSAVQETLSGFAEDWNARRPDRLIALPRELGSEIFRQLDFEGRITVSHVCTSWRTAALADRVLWAEYSIAPRAASSAGLRWDIGVKAHVLSVLLERSCPTPFSLIAHNVPDAIAELIIRHIHRMKLLWLGDFQTRGALHRLPRLDIPMLKFFTCHVPAPDDVPLSVSPVWAVSHLQRLEISGTWLWPAGCVSLSVRSLRGNLPEVLDDTWRLTDLFPNLEDLRLEGIRSHGDIVRLDPLPHALSGMSLLPLRDRVDYAPLLRNCRASSLRLLQLSHPSTASSLHEVIRLYLRTCSGPWTLRVDAREVVLSAVCADPLYKYQLRGYVESWLSCAPRALVSWVKLCALDLRLEDLLDLWPAVVPGTVLPALGRLTIRTPHPHVSIRLHELNNGAHIDAPALASVAFPRSLTNKMSEYNNRDRSIVTETLRAFRAPALWSVEIEADYVDTTRREHVVGLTGLTKRVVIRSPCGRSGTIIWDLATPGAPEL